MSRKFRVTWLEKQGDPAIEYSEIFETNVDQHPEAVPNRFMEEHRKECGALSKILRVEALD